MDAGNFPLGASRPGKAGRLLLGEFSDQTKDRMSHSACEATVKTFDANIRPSFTQPITMLGSNGFSFPEVGLTPPSKPPIPMLRQGSDLPFFAYTRCSVTC